MPTSAKSRYLTPNEAAERLGMSIWSVYRAIGHGSLPGFRLRPMGALSGVWTSPTATPIQVKTFAG
jgi:hypothetical protein